MTEVCRQSANSERLRKDVSAERSLWMQASDCTFGYR